MVENDDYWHISSKGRRPLAPESKTEFPTCKQTFEPFQTTNTWRIVWLAQAPDYLADPPKPSLGSSTPHKDIQHTFYLGSQYKLKQESEQPTAFLTFFSEYSSWKNHCYPTMYFSTIVSVKTTMAPAYFTRGNTIYVFYTLKI